MKKLLIALAFLLAPAISYAAPFNSAQLAPSASSGNCLTTNGSINAWSSCGSGGGGSGTFSTTSPFGTTQLQYPTVANTVTSLDTSATSTSKWWFNPIIALQKITGSFWVTASSTLANFTALNATTTQATTTALAITGTPSALLKTNSIGSVVPALSGTDFQPAGSYVLNIGPAGQLQSNATITIASSTTGTDFSITASGNTITFSLPTASASNRGALSAADWTTFNNKGSGTVYPFLVAPNATTTTVGFYGGLLSTASTTINAQLNLPTLSNGGLGVFGGIVTSSATTTAGTGLTYSGNSFNVNTTQNITNLSNLTSNGAIITTGGNGTLTTYGTGVCLNQFIRSLNASLVPTCATVGSGDVNLATMSATDGTLTFSGTYNGQVNRTVGLNLASSNVFTAASTTYVGNLNWLNSTSTNATTTSLATNTVCIQGDCRTAWPTGGGGGGSSTFSTTSPFGTTQVQYPTFSPTVTSLDTSATSTSKFYFDSAINLVRASGSIGTTSLPVGYINTTNITLGAAGQAYIYSLFGASSPISYNNTTGSIGLNTVPISKGGTGQITQGAAFDALSPMTTKGDIITRSILTNQRLGVGTDGQVLTASSSTATGLDWITPSAGGSGSYPFTQSGNGTSTLTQFNGGLTAYASSTIGAGTQTTGLTINGGATTTGAIVAPNTAATSTISGILWVDGGISSVPSNAWFGVGNGTIQALNITKSGQAGFGTTTPAAQVEIASSTGQQLALSDGSLTSAQWNMRNTGGTLYVSTSSPSTNATSTIPALQVNSTGYPGLSISSSTPFGQFTVDTSQNPAGNNEVSIGSTTRSDFLISNVGNVGIGTTSPYRRLSVVGGMAVNGLTAVTGGNAICLNTTTFDFQNAGLGTCATSAFRFKTNIDYNLPANFATNELMQLKPVSFDYKPGYHDTNETAHSYGLIAEDVEKVDPALVDYCDDGEVCTLHFEKITGLLVKAVQELDGKIGEAKRSAEENWQWVAIVLLGAGFIYQQIQIRKLKK